MRAVAGLAIAGLLLAGCAHPSSTTYETGDVGRTIETAQGSIVSSRVVKISGDSNAAGPLAGGALGAAGSALAFQGSGLVAVIGGVLTSTLLTLIAIPTFYEILLEWREWFGRKLGFRTPETAEHRVVPEAAPAGD